MRYLRLFSLFMQVSAQEEVAYRLNFWINLLHSLLNLATGLLGVSVLFSQVDSLRGWTYAGTLAVLGVYQVVGALRGLFIGPSLDSLAGMDGDVWSGRLDFTLLRPVNTQFLASFRRWRFFALFDLILGLGVLGFAALQLGQAWSLARLAMFLLAIFAAMMLLYAILLAFTALVFWSPGVLFTWIFDGIFQLARYPVGLYPGWLRLVLTWVIPVGLITSVPAEALAGTLSAGMLAGSLGLAIVLLAGASVLFRLALRGYSSASS